MRRAKTRLERPKAESRYGKAPRRSSPVSGCVQKYKSLRMMRGTVDASIPEFRGHSAVASGSRTENYAFALSAVSAARNASGSPATAQRQPIFDSRLRANFSLTSARFRSLVTKTSARRRASEA